MKFFSFYWLAALLCSLFWTVPCGAVQPNSLFADGMVLQRDQPIAVWGTGREGENVTVKIGDQSATAKVTGGKWSVTLPPLSASATPVPFTIAGDNTVTISNVLVGEVWVCSGQSNMERPLGLRPPQPPIDNWEQEAASADLPTLRQFYVPEKSATVPPDDVKGKWMVCTPQNALQFTAVGLFFARALQEKLQVPVGLLFAAVGGTTGETWTRREALLSRPETADLVHTYDQDLAAYPDKLAQWNADSPALLAKYDADTAALPPGSKPLPKPQPPHNPAFTEPGCHFNAMVAPLAPFAVRGVIWYQAESNSGRAAQYRVLLPLLITDWRAVWNRPDLPFLIVQLPGFNGTHPEMREAQQAGAASVPDTALVVTTDLGQADNIHPPHKRPVGERLALAARTLVYGEQIESSGPLFNGADFTGSQAVVKFTHLGGGLVAKTTPLTGFEVAGADQKFVPADARIEGDTVIVSSAQVTAPAAVRYDWTNVPEVSLYNQAGLPAAPFRTDTD